MTVLSNNIIHSFLKKRAKHDTEMEQEKVKVWMRISGQGEDEAIGIRIPNRRGMTISELKRVMTPLVSFDGFPVTVNTILPEHLDVTCNDELLGEDALVLDHLTHTFVISPNAVACAGEDENSKLANIWNELPSTMDEPTGSPSSSTATAARQHDSLLLSPLKVDVGPGNVSTPTNANTPITKYLPGSPFNKQSSPSSPKMTKIPHISNRRLMTAIDDIQKPDWEVQVEGLSVIQRVAIHHQKMLNGCLQSALQAITGCIRSLRSAVVKTALQTFTDIVKGVKHDQKSLEAQLELISYEILRISASDNHFLRDAADDCFSEITAAITDHLRFRLLYRILVALTNSKNGVLRSQGVAVISLCVKRSGDLHVRGYAKTGLLLKSLNSFLNDASDSCRHNGRELATILAGKYGGEDELTQAMYHHLSHSQVEGICKAMGPTWVVPPTPPSRSPQITPRRSPTPPKSRSNSPARHNGAPESLKAKYINKHIPGSLTRSVNSPSRRLDQVSTLSDLSDISVNKCKGFKAAWGNPTVCGLCRQSKGTHQNNKSDWDVQSAGHASLKSHNSGAGNSFGRSNTHTHNPPSRGKLTPRGALSSLSGRPPVKKTLRTGNTTRTISPSARLRKTTSPSLRSSVNSMASAGFGSTFGGGSPVASSTRSVSRDQVRDRNSLKCSSSSCQSELSRLKEEIEHQKDMILNLVSENQTLKKQLEQKEIIDSVQHITLLTTPEFGTEGMAPPTELEDESIKTSGDSTT